MARRTRANLVVQTARRYVDVYMPELHGASLRLHRLDGPPSSPRYAVTAEACLVARCPRGIPTALAEAGECPIRTCPLRRSVRLLFSRGGDIIQVVRSQVHWG